MCKTRLGLLLFFLRREIYPTPFSDYTNGYSASVFRVSGSGGYNAGHTRHRHIMGVYSCSQCSKICTSSRGLTQHTNACHQIRSTSPELHDADAEGNSSTYRYHPRLDGTHFLVYKKVSLMYYMQPKYVTNLATTYPRIRHHLLHL